MLIVCRGRSREPWSALSPFRLVWIVQLSQLYLWPNPLSKHGLIQSLVPVLRSSSLGAHAMLLSTMPHILTSLITILSVHYWWVVWSWRQEYPSSRCPFVRPTCLPVWQCCDKGCPCNIGLRWQFKSVSPHNMEGESWIQPLRHCSLFPGLFHEDTFASSCY